MEILNWPVFTVVFISVSVLIVGFNYYLWMGLYNYSKLSMDERIEADERNVRD